MDWGGDLELGEREGRVERVVRVVGERHRLVAVEDADLVGLRRAGAQEHEVAFGH